MLHRIFRGHWFTPHFIEHDQRPYITRDGEMKASYAAVYGCEVCLIQDPVRFYRDIHNKGICPKSLMGYTCHGRANNGVEFAECGRV